MASNTKFWAIRPQQKSPSLKEEPLIVSIVVFSICVSKTRSLLETTTMEALFSFAFAMSGNTGHAAKASPAARRKHPSASTPERAHEKKHVGCLMPVIM